jgi:cell wall-associated NlpC family hydrolase
MATVAVMATGSLAASATGFTAVTSDGVGDSQLIPGPISQAALVGGADARGGAGGGKSLAAAMANPAPQFTTLSIAAEKPTIRPNGEAMFTVRALEAGTGAPLARRQVRIVVVNGPRWSTSAILQTDDKGTARIGARLLTTTTITAVFDGDGALRPSLAGAATVSVNSPTSSSGSGAAAGSGRSAATTPSVVPGSTIGAKAVYVASQQKGKPYIYGATGPYAFDCSGYAQYIYKQLGRYLPRTAQQQYNATLRVPKSGKQPGDLIFFGSPSNVTHMGVYAGNGYMWAAPQTGRTVNLQPIYTSTYWVGRVL